MSGRGPGRGLSRGLKGTVRHVGGLFVGWIFEAARTPPPGLPTGGVTSPEGDNRPVILAVLLDADAEAVTITAKALSASAQRGGPRAVLLLDGPWFAAARRNGVIAFHVLSREAWSQRHDPARWDAYFEGEVMRLRADLGADEVIRLPSAGTEGVLSTVLDAWLDPPALSRLRTTWRHGVVRWERRIDKGAD